MNPIAFLLLLLIPIPKAKSQDLGAREILNRAIQYHDPSQQWAQLNQLLLFDELRPDGSVRKTTTHIDNSRGFFRLNRGNEEIAGMVMDSCFIEKGTYDCARAKTMRDYYLYLWGLPMKLMDAGTPLQEEVETETINGRTCYVLRVNYDKDTWFFYFASNNFEMLAYKFYQDEALANGEFIQLEGEIQVSEMRLPQRRSWYTIPDERHLGTDVLTGSESPK